MEAEVEGRSYEDVPVEEIESGRHKVGRKVQDKDDLLQLLSWACEPGDCVVFHGLTLHGAK